MRPVTAALLALVLVAGCGGGGGRRTTTPSDHGVLVRYERRGGVAAADLVLTVYRDGRATRATSGPSSRTTSLTLAPAQLAALRAALAAADVPHLRSSTAPAPADAYEYRLTYEGRTVRVVEGRAPRPLTRVIALLEGRAYSA